MYGHDSFSYVSGFIAGGALGWIIGQYLHIKIVNLFAGTPGASPNASNESSSEASPNVSPDVTLDKSLDKSLDASNASEKFSVNENISYEIDRDQNTVTLHLTNEAFERLIEYAHEYTKSVSEQIFDEVAENLEVVPSKVQVQAPVFTGKYVTLENFGQTKNIESPLSKQEELEIMNRFREIVGKSLDIAKELAAEEGFQIHVIYVGMCNLKVPLGHYDSKTIGVRVKIVKDEYHIGGIVDDSAQFITEIIDVGGVDLNDRGIIKL